MKNRILTDILAGLKPDGGSEEEWLVQDEDGHEQSICVVETGLDTFTIEYYPNVSPNTDTVEYRAGVVNPCRRTFQVTLTEVN